MEPMQQSDTTIQLRASKFDRDLIDRAAQVKGMNRTQFMLNAALNEAKNAILDETTLFVDGETFAAIIDQLENTTPASDALMKTLNAKSPWDRG